MCRATLGFSFLLVGLHFRRTLILKNREKRIQVTTKTS